jgi:hypothetical protein
VKTPTSFAFERLFKGSQLVNAFRKLVERRDERRHLADPALREAEAEHLARSIPKFSSMAAGIGAVHLAVLQPYLHLRADPPEAERDIGARYLYRKDAMIDVLEGAADGLAVADWPDRSLYVDGLRIFDADRGVTCFEDEVHLTPEGSRLLLRHIVERVRASGLMVRGR